LNSFLYLKINRVYTRTMRIIYSNRRKSERPQTILSLENNIVLTIENTCGYVKKYKKNFCHSVLSLVTECNKMSNNVRIFKTTLSI